jgi:hypothetical protein
VHQPKRGIASARNAALGKAMKLGADRIAFIDDDEVVEQDWLDGMMEPGYLSTPVLIGRHVPDYPMPRPFWALEKQPRDPEEGASPRHLRTGNVRFSVELVKAGLRFDEALNMLGGEDQKFFHQALQRGFEARYTNRAVVHEEIHPSRLTDRAQIYRHYAHMASVTFREQQEEGTMALVGLVPRALVLMLVLVFGLKAQNAVRQAGIPLDRHIVFLRQVSTLDRLRPNGRPNSLIPGCWPVSVLTARARRAVFSPRRKRLSRKLGSAIKLPNNAKESHRVKSRL